VGIEFLNPESRADVKAVADLHREYLSDSPVVKMGRHFLQSFYYGECVQTGLIGCMLCRVDGRVVGFISYTEHPDDFMIRGMRRGFVRLAWWIAVSVAMGSTRIKDLVFVLRLMRERSRTSNRDAAQGVGEVLSMVVLPEYQSHVLPGGDCRLAVRLFESTAKHFRNRSFKRLRMHVQPSNVASNMFWNALGCRFEKTAAAGVPVYRYLYDLEEGTG
jgi:hypothetical protein